MLFAKWSVVLYVWTVMLDVDKTHITSTHNNNNNNKNSNHQNDSNNSKPAWTVTS
jgi:hypothetical protein